MAHHPKPTSAQKRDRRKLLLFGLVTTLVVLAVLECGSRLAGTVEYPPDPLIAEGNAKWGHSREYDSHLFWRLRPGATIQKDTVNSLGLRGPEVPRKKRDEFRVLSLGESTTYGWKIPYRQSYTARLESRLREVRSTRFINAGLPGYSLFQGRVFLEYRGLDLSPDAVLLYFGFNDYLNVAFREERDALGGGQSAGLTDRQLFSRRQRLSTKAVDWLYHRSNFVRWLGSRVHSVGHSTGGPEREATGDGVSANPAVRRVPDDDRWESLTEALQICRANDIELIIIIPWYKHFEGHAPLLRRFAEEFQLASVDLPVLLAHLSDRKDEFFIDDSHPNAEGHRVIADAIWTEVGELFSVKRGGQRGP